ncbi:hypothetical protein HC256_008893 [Beauveria bassiana]|nr:hypothetical protein HC256_008893 [Beauveria bassiana]
MSVPQASFESYKIGDLERDNATLHPHSAGDYAPRWDYSSRPILTCDRVPWEYIWIEAGRTQMVSFLERFEGRIQRGVGQYIINMQEAQPLVSWLEISWDKYNI